MATYGIVIEGDYDEAVLTEFIKRFLHGEVEVIARKCRSKGYLMNKFPVYLHSFRYEKRGSHVDKALIIRDADGKPPHDLIERMRDKIANQHFPFEVKFVVIVQELEAWLLADELAISRVSCAPKAVKRINESLESIEQPKELLFKILSQAGIGYTDVIARNIAKESDLEKVAYRCPAFSKFREAVMDC